MLGLGKLVGIASALIAGASGLVGLGGAAREISNSGPVHPYEGISGKRGRPGIGKGRGRYAGPDHTALCPAKSRRAVQLCRRVRLLNRVKLRKTIFATTSIQSAHAN